MKYSKHEIRKLFIHQSFSIGGRNYEIGKLLHKQTTDEASIGEASLIGGASSSIVILSVSQDGPPALHFGGLLSAEALAQAGSPVVFRVRQNAPPPALKLRWAVLSAEALAQAGLPLIFVVSIFAIMSVKNIFLIFLFPFFLTLILSFGEKE